LKFQTPNELLKLQPSNHVALKEFPVRFPVFVMRLAELKATQDASHANESEKSTLAD
jgi:hypothetical protein